MPQKQEADVFWEYISRSIERILTCLDDLSEDDLNWRPLDNANSLYAISTHILGTTEENMLSVLCGQPTHQQREAEFAAKGTSTEPVRAQWQDLKERVEQCLAQLPPEELDRERKHPRRGQLTGREVLIVVARHAAEHMGHAELTRDLLFAERGRALPARQY